MKLSDIKWSDEVPKLGGWYWFQRPELGFPPKLIFFSAFGAQLFIFPAPAKPLAIPHQAYEKYFAGCRFSDLVYPPGASLVKRNDPKLYHNWPTWVDGELKTHAEYVAAYKKAGGKVFIVNHETVEEA